MKLASSTDVLARLSVNDQLGGAVSSAEAGLEAAAILLANMLESDMYSAEIVDLYSPALSNVDKPLKLYLSRMFINKDEGVEVSYGVYSGDIDADVYEVLDPINYSIDYADGSIKIDSIPTYGKLSLKVSYFAGFSGENDSTIPSWLKEAAITAAVYVMHTQVAAHGKKDIIDVSPEYRRIIYAMVQQHLRSRMNCMFAEMSQEVD